MWKSKVTLLRYLVKDDFCLLKSIQNCPSTKLSIPCHSFSTSSSLLQIPWFRSINEKNEPTPTAQPHRIIRQAWVENLSSIKEEKLEIMDLNPEVFAHPPRMEILQQNIRWQVMYQRINWISVKTRAEMPGGGRKPWPQKGTGRARHGSIRSPIFYNGGKAHGPRGPTTYFYMLDFHSRVQGLCIALTSKLAQDDLKIVDSLDIPVDEPKYIQDLAEERSWGVSVLFVDDTDMMPKNITMATDEVKSFNLMPVYGLNVYSMLKHETLVLTKAAANRIQERLLFQLHRNDAYEMISKSAKPVQIPNK